MTSRKSFPTISDPVVSRLNAVIKFYLPEYNRLISTLDNPSGFPEFGHIHINPFNERTIAHFFDIHLEHSLNHVPLLAPHLFLSECKFEYDLSSAEKESANREVDSTLSGNNALETFKSSSHSTFIPDTVISTTISPPASRVIYCIEYKRDSHYQYVKLALDYLKYKYYSSGFASPSIFVYILFYTKPTALIFKSSVELRRNLKQDKRYANKSLYYTTLPPAISSPFLSSSSDSVTNQDSSFVHSSEPPFPPEILFKIGETLTELSQLETVENSNIFFNDIDFPEPNKDHDKINSDRLLSTINNNLRELKESLDRKIHSH